ncbi:hypothetical protein R3P38DRAFT_2721387 [Favolaschia claudopus]|uniref:F-box domain-containing protein n=1 Tax=Favolaschia claudopus TaxID=2862362 RepID=A0AAW0AIS4_9AGAR
MVESMREEKSYKNEAGVDYPVELQADVSKLMSALRLPSPDEDLSGLHAECAALHAKAASLYSMAAALHERRRHVVAGGKGRAVLETETVPIEEMAALEDRIRIAELRIQTHTPLASLVRRIPPEIICEILLWTMPHDVTRKVGDDSVPVAPWRLGHICQDWRRAARADVRLWSHIRIEIPYFQFGINDDVFSVENHCPLAALLSQISLSTSSGLTINVCLGFGTPKSTHPYLVTLLEVIANESHRWERFISNNIREEHCEIYAPLLKTEGHLDNLKSLEISGAWPRKLEDIFMAAPQLHNVSLMPTHESWSHRFWDPTRSPSVRLPWQQLRQLSACYEPRVLHKVLERVQYTVSELRLSYCDRNIRIPEDQVPAPCLLLPNLGVLSVATDHSFLYNIKAPNLRKLTTCGAVNAAFKFISRSQCQLSALHLDKCDEESSSIIALLQAVPNLLDVRMVFVSGRSSRESLMAMGEIFHALIAVPGSNHLCPHLAQMHFAVARATEQDVWDQIFAVVESRMAPIGALRGVHLQSVFEGNDSVPTSIFIRFSRWRTLGLEVTYDSLNNLGAYLVVLL